MKKLLTSFILLAGIITFSACSDNSNEGEDIIFPEEPENPEEPSEPINPNDTIKWTITIGVKNVTEDDFKYPVNDLGERNIFELMFNRGVVIDSVDWGIGQGFTWVKNEDNWGYYDDGAGNRNGTKIKSNKYPLNFPDKIYTIVIKGHGKITYLSDQYGYMHVATFDSEGCEHLLQKLILSQSTLSSLNFDKYTALEKLEIRNYYSRKFEEAPKLLNVSKCTTLRRLIINNYALSSLDVSSNSRLEYLDCSGNSLENLDVSNNLKLKQIRCNNNRLSSLDVSKNLSLEALACQDNQLTTIQINSTSELASLKCKNNQLSEKVLEDICHSLPKGKIWTYIDYSGYNDSWEHPKSTCVSGINAENNPGWTSNIQAMIKAKEWETYCPEGVDSDFDL